MLYGLRFHDIDLVNGHENTNFNEKEKTLFYLRFLFKHFSLFHISLPLRFS